MFFVEPGTGEQWPCPVCSMSTAHNVVAKTALRNSAPDVTHAQVPSVAADSGP